MKIISSESPPELLQEYCLELINEIKERTGLVIYFSPINQQNRVHPWNCTFFIKDDNGFESFEVMELTEIIKYCEGMISGLRFQLGIKEIIKNSILEKSLKEIYLMERQQIMLRSNVLKITKVIKPTKAKMFKDLSAGNEILISIPVKRAGENRGNTYSSYLEIKNINTDEVVHKSFNQISSILKCFEFKELC